MPFNNNTGDTVERDVPVSCQCEACKLARFESSTLRGAVVHQYSYRPRQWKMNHVPNDPFDYFMGVELETDNYRTDRATGGRVRSRMTNEQAAGMRLPKMLWMAKRDGSVSGPEFVSHPATLTYWQANKSKVAEMFKMLVHSGFRSHDNDHAGMHINISKNAFADPQHLFRFLTLIHGNAAWSLKMSQRTNASAEQWASISYLADETRRQSEVDRIMPADPNANPYYMRGSSHRYQALNCPSGQSRFEFRLPRGTLRIDRFLKNLEWTVAMIEFSRNQPLSKMKSLDFMRWAVANIALYPNLVKFMSERFEDIIIAAPGIDPLADGDETVDVNVTTPVVTSTDGARISPRTGRPVRTYNRRPGAGAPGRPVGYRPSLGRVVRQPDRTWTADFTFRPLNVEA